jgi:murein DD-endopeptidase MepM/ murein hydrolase activator NlpD
MWHSPIPLSLRVTDQSESFQHMAPHETGLPVGSHPGAFGVVRRFHVHEGVDLYCEHGTLVHAVEAGVVVAIKWFTGAQAGLSHWHDTLAVFVEGASGVVVYGEIMPSVVPGQRICAGDRIGSVIRVLRKDKGRPMSMLHLELHRPGVRVPVEWYQECGRPESLLDPTPYLLPLAR